MSRDRLEDGARVKVQAGEVEGQHETEEVRGLHVVCGKGHCTYRDSVVVSDTELGYMVS